MQKYFDSVTTSGGRPAKGVSVTVTKTADGSLAALYSDNGVNARANPVVTDANGYFEFYAADGRYNIAVSGTGITTRTITDVLLEDPVDGSAVLAAPSGASLVGYIAAGAGAVSRSTQDKMRESVSVMDFGAKGDGATDDTAAFLSAATSLGAGGGTVYIPAQGKFLIDSNLTVPANVTFKGPHSLNGSPGTNTSAAYGNVKGAIVINSAATITLSGGAGFDGVLVYRKGMTFPATDASAFAGTAFAAAGDDAFLINSQVMGFNKAYYSTGYQRPRIYSNWIDNNNGIEITNCADVAHVSDNHAWPFATIAALGPATSLRRSGIAYYFHDMGDWNKSTNNFSYGYFRGHMLTNVNSMTLIGASHDNTTGYTGSIGIAVTGNSADTRIIAAQSAAQDIGIYVNTSAGTHTTIQAANTWVNTGHSMLIDGGDVTVQGSFRNAPYGVSINNASSRVSVHRSRFSAITGRPIHNILSTPYLDIGPNDYGDLAAGQTVADGVTPVTIASADPINLPPTGDFFVISGNTNFGTVNGAWPGRKVTLKFTGTLTVNDGGASLKLNGNLSATPNTTLSIIGDSATSWVETGRSVN